MEIKKSLLLGILVGGFDFFFFFLERENRFYFPPFGIENGL